MSCTFQSAFQRQLFIKMFSGTYNRENVTATDEGGDHHSRAVIYLLTSVFVFFSPCPDKIVSPCYVSDQVVLERRQLKVFMTTRLCT